MIKLTAKTIATLKKMYDVDQSIKIPADSTTLRIKSQNNTMMAKCEIDVEFPRDVHIYDIREFNSVVAIVDNPELDFSDDRFVLVKSADGKQKLRYLEAEASLIHSFIEKDLVLPSEEIELKVTQHELKSVMTAANTMKLEYVGFIGSDGVITLSSFNKNNGDGNDTNNFSIEVGETDVDFRMFYKLDIHNIGVLLDEGDLTITISAKNKVSQIVTETGKIFWIALDAKSEYVG